MSWLFKSLQAEGIAGADAQASPPLSSGQGSGVKEDISMFGDAIGRQLRGVAAFLAPPPTGAAAERDEGQREQLSDDRLLGMRNDLAEIGNSFKSGLSRLSGNKAVSGISRFASNFLQFQNQGDREDGVPGITEEVVDFVKEISSRPECWTDFPLSLDNDFIMSDAQSEHALTIEHLVPSIAALRLKLQSSLGEEIFWMIYFIFLLPRLNEHDFVLLSSPKVVDTRDILLEKLQKSRNGQVNNSGESDVSEITNAAQGLKIHDVESPEQWWEEADNSSDTSFAAQKKLGHEEDVSFSDLEDDENELSDRSPARKPIPGTKASPSGSNDWVQLNTSPDLRGSQKARISTSRDKDSEGESSDWLAVDDYD